MQGIIKQLSKSLYGYLFKIFSVSLAFILISCNEDPKFTDYPFHSQAIIYDKGSSSDLIEGLWVRTLCDDSYKNCGVEDIYSEAFTLQRHEDGAFLYFNDPGLDSDFADYIYDGTKLEILKESYESTSSAQYDSCHKVCWTGTNDCWTECTYWRDHYRKGVTNQSSVYSLLEIEFRLIKDEKIVFYVHYLE